MTTKQRAALRSLSNNLKPIIQIGKGGINDNLIETIKTALFCHELIKISVLRTCDYSAAELCKLLELRTGASPVSVIGSKIVLYKYSDKQGIEHITV